VPTVRIENPPRPYRQEEFRKSLLFNTFRRAPIAVATTMDCRSIRLRSGQVVPLNGFACFLEILSRFLFQLLLGEGGIDGVAAIVSEPVLADGCEN
jgi:hypothetical protein